jgi:hypothetical protein
VRTLFSRGDNKEIRHIGVDFDEAGLMYGPTGTAGRDAVEWLSDPNGYADWQLVAYLAQLHEEGWGPDFDDKFILPWDSLYQLFDLEEHEGSLALLSLPAAAEVVPSLEAVGSLADPEFGVALTWKDGSGKRVDVTRVGGVARIGGRETLLSGAAWQLAEGVRTFARRTDRSREANDREWGRLRALAVKASARMDDFLVKTIVLTPEKLDLGLLVVEAAGARVVEVTPNVEGAPPQKWLEALDRHSRVQDHYDLTQPDGSIIRVVPDDAVKEVLREIKAMPGRRIAGKRAQQFLRNPYAVIGEAMQRVVSPERFEKLRAEAGIRFFDFDIQPERNERGHVVGVDVAPLLDDEEAEPAPAVRIGDKVALSKFATVLAKALDAGDPCISWSGIDLDLRGNAPEQLARLSGLLADAWAGPQAVLRQDEVFDLSRYSARITGIDAYKPVFSPHIPKTDKGVAWLPESIDPVILWEPPGLGEAVSFVVTRENLALLRDKTDAAQAAGKEYVEMPNWPAPVPVADALGIIEAFEPQFSDDDTGRLGVSEKPFEPYDAGPAEQDDAPKAKLQLLIGENIDAADYAEERGRMLAFDLASEPELPGSLAPDVCLKPHQLIGVAWLQHLWRFSAQVRGCVFADDMGLGKTLQLLTFIHWMLESEGEAAQPVLVVAPVSLLENWQNELNRFFVPGASRVLTLYGAALSSRKLSKGAVDPALIEKGLVKFLKPGWRGDAQIVLTSYETLRDMELSLAAERWSMVICDEAQKIKTPNALVTRAAKKQNARFRIACTGTPVENSLTDLWCLFDFIQPGLLGPLNEFSNRYVRPIEARTEEERHRVDELRALIQPQVLRRTKAEVADLPPKDEQTVLLPISAKQLALYSRAVEVIRSGQNSASGAILLSMLHTLRMICADPRSVGLSPMSDVPLEEYCRHSPKMAWLLDRLEEIRKVNEKVIVFSEFREIQRLLQRYIGQRFAISVSVINGDTKVQTGRESAQAATRQKLLDLFQEKAGFNVIVLSTTAIGFGVNIQAANHVIHYTRPWNPAKEDQATDRAYRIGQEKPVHVHYPTITGTNFVTFEEKLDQLLQSKRRLAGDMLNGYDDIDAAEFAELVGSNTSSTHTS